MCAFLYHGGMFFKASRLLLGLLIVLLVSGVGLALWKQNVPQPEAISAIIVPHHDLVANLRQKLFTEGKVQALHPSTVILISPNHYENGSADIQTTTQPWETQEGTLAPNTDLINALSTQSLATITPESFGNEHGIRNIVGDLKTTFPSATVVPLIFRLRTSETEVTKLNAFLTSACQNCLVVASVDFSHYQPAPLADLHDTVTLRGLFTQDRALLSKLAETDSPAALSFTVAWAQSHQTNHFNLWNHTNSSTLAGDPNILGTSHVFGWYETGSTAFAPAEATFSIGTALPNTDQFNRSFWGSDVRILFGSDQPAPMRPGEVQVTATGLHTWDNRDVTSFSFATPLPVQVRFDTGQDFSFTPSDHVIVIVSSEARAEYAATHGADLIATAAPLTVSSLHDIPVVVARPGILVSGIVQPKLATVTNALVLQNN